MVKVLRSRSELLSSREWFDCVNNVLFRGCDVVHAGRRPDLDSRFFRCCCGGVILARVVRPRVFRPSVSSLVVTAATGAPVPEPLVVGSSRQRGANNHYFDHGGGTAPSLFYY